MKVERELKVFGYVDVIAYTGKDITEEMIDECIEINKTFYKKEFVFQDNIKDIILNRSQMCFVFVDKSTIKNKVIGYSFWLPIKTKIFNEYIKTKKTLNLFEDSCFLPYKDGSINLFLASEAFVLGYDIKKLHKAVEDIFQKRVLDLAYNGIFVKYIAMEGKCKYDDLYLAKVLGFTQNFKKEKTTFYFDEYSPKKVYKDSSFADELYPFYPIKK